MSDHEFRQQRCCPECKRRYDKIRKIERVRGGRRTLPAVGTVRRLHALQALGYSVPAIAAAAGVPPATLANPLHRGDGVHARTAAAVRRAYDQLSMTLPAGGYAERSRRAAEAKGWSPPLAWDDASIDDPDARPVGARRAERDLERHPDVVDEVVVQRLYGGDFTIPSNRAERAEVVRRWIAAGRSMGELARMSGWKVERYGKKAA